MITTVTAVNPHDLLLLFIEAPQLNSYVTFGIVGFYLGCQKSTHCASKRLYDTFIHI